MASQMYFGTKAFMQWVPCPAINAEISRLGWGSTQQYLNGGAGVVRSTGAHKEYGFSWNLAPQSEIYKVLDYDTGIYGNGLIYFLDPMAMTQNVLPATVAAPGLAYGTDAPNLSPLLAPTAGPATPANTFNYPLTGATYSTGVAGQSIIWVPVPLGWKAVFGFTGSGTAMRYQGDGGVATTATMISVTSSTRANTTYVPTTAAQTGITLMFPTSGTSTLYGIYMVIIPSTASATPYLTGNFVSGRGHSGCRFADRPQVNGYSSPLGIDKVGATARLIETGSWE